LGTTANRNYPYPEPTDPADFAQAMQDLAEAVDTDMEALENLITLPPMMVASGVAADNQINPGVETAMVYSIVNYDNDNIADLAGSSSSFNVTTSGTYFAHFLARVPDSTASMDAFIRVDGTDYGLVQHQGDAPASPLLVVSALLPNLTSNDSVTTSVTQNTASVQSIVAPRLTLYRVA
jgi:hypothetical protein